MRWAGQAYCSVLPRGHSNIAPFQGNVLVVSLLWAVESQVLLASYYSEVWFHLLWECTSGILFQVRRMSIFQHWLLSPHRNVAWVPCLVFLDSLQGYSLRCRGCHLSTKVVHTLRIQLALKFLTEICLENLQCPSVITCRNICRNIFPKRRWWYRFWMHLDPI